MQKELTPSRLAKRLSERFTSSMPLFLTSDEEALKFEIKPYLQPFEQDLAVRELIALVGPEGRVFNKYGYHLACTDKNEEVFRQRLTYWQRVGKSVLTPTVQKQLEFTQNGVNESNGTNALHRARRLRYGPHGIHEYRGKFFPQLVRSLINISGVADDGIICDPMSGSGTTACEALAAGHSVVAADLNPLSVLITRVKAALVLESADGFRLAVSRYINAFEFDGPTARNLVWSASDFEYLQRWFAPAALKDLAAAELAIRAVRKPLYRDFFRVCLSNIIRSVSWQKDTDLRVRKEVKGYKPGTAIARFIEEVQKQVDRIYPYLCVLPKLSPRPFLDVRQGDAIDAAALFQEYSGRVGLLVTSPPYATALPYLDTDRLSLIVLGLLPRARHGELEAKMVGTREVSERERAIAWELYLHRRHELPQDVTKLIEQIADSNHQPEVGFRRRNLPALLGKYFLDMLDAMRSARMLMTRGARGYYVVGNNSTTVDGEKVYIPTDNFLFEIGAKAGWKQEERIPMDLIISRDIFKENRGSTETILSFRA